MVFLRCLNIYGSYFATPVVSSLWFEAVCFQSSIPSFSTLFYYIVHFFVLVRYVQDVRIGRVGMLPNLSDPFVNSVPAYPCSV